LKDILSLNNNAINPLLNASHMSKMTATWLVVSVSVD